MGEHGFHGGIVVV